MQRLAPGTTQFLAALAVTAAAVAAAFSIPVPAQALTITVTGDGGGQFISGSGKEVSVARKTGSFTVLRIDSSLDVTAHQGSNPSVTVHADDNIEPLIETVVDGDALVVRMKKNTSFRTNHKIVVDIEFATLAATRQHGSGDLHIASVSGPRLESSIAGSGDLHIANAKLGSFSLSIAGSGDAILAGSADEARFAVAGSGDVEATRFAVRRVNASISGSGDARLNATESLDTRVAGSGDIRYAGHPRDVSRHVSGSGSVEASD
jgi:hypothetical protein